MFSAWIDAAMISKWFAPAEGFTTTVSELDLRVGGRYRFEMLAPDGETYIAIGEYISITSPAQLVFGK